MDICSELRGGARGRAVETYRGREQVHGWAQGPGGCHGSRNGCFREFRRQSQVDGRREIKGWGQVCPLQFEN